MFKYFGKLLEDTKIYTYNYFNKDPRNSTSVRIYSPFPDDVPYVPSVPDTTEANSNTSTHATDTTHTTSITSADDKQLRIDTLLFVRQYKNTYYKYAKKDKFNQELYDTFISENNFDGGLTAYDEDDNMRIFDKYILEYIKNRNDVLTFLQCRNKGVNLKEKVDDLSETRQSSSHIDVLFTIDMSEKDLFNYCHSILANIGSIVTIKNIIFSLIINHNGEYIRMKLNSFNKDKRGSHPYLILEKFIS